MKSEMDLYRSVRKLGANTRKHSKRDTHRFGRGSIAGQRRGGRSFGQRATGLYTQLFTLRPMIPRR